MRHLIFRVLYTIALFVPFVSSNSALAQEVIKVGAGEYLTVYLMDNRTVRVSSQSTVTPLLATYPGLDSIVDVQGGQYHATALDVQGNAYRLDKNGGYIMTSVDEFGAAFTGNFQVKGFWQCDVSLRGTDSSLWYWGIADPMNYRAGSTITAPIKLTMPVGRKFKKIETGASWNLSDSYILALATDNTVWKYIRGNATPVQISVGGTETFKDIATLGGNAQVLLSTTDELFAAGYLSSYAGTSGNSSSFKNVTSAWRNAGMTFPIKELVGNSSTLHIIDANDHMFGSGTNVQGEVGTGVEYSPYRIAGPQGGVFGYGFTNGVLLTPPTQIQGKFKNINTGTTITFYFFVQDMGNSWYSWGRNKGFCLGNGKSLGPYAGWGGIGDYAAYPNAMDVPMPKRVNLTTLVWTLQNFNPSWSIPPVVGAGINQYISASSTILYGKAFQQEFSIVSSLWSKISGPAGGIIANPNALNTSITSLQSGVYVYRLSATNSNGQTSTDEVSILVTVGNIPPVANAGLDTSFTLPVDTVFLNGSATDADGSISSYLWVKISGPTLGVINNPTAAAAQVTNVIAGVYLYELTATDNAGATGKDTVSVTIITAGNQAPIAAAGADQTIMLPVDSAILSGVGTDADGTIGSCLWVKIAGPSAGSTTNPDSANAKATGLISGVYEYQLTVVDNLGAIGRDTVVVTVNTPGNQAPTANAGLDASITLPTNTTGLNGSGTDSDGTIAAYQWKKVAGPVAGNISNATVALTNATALVQGTYRFELRVTDNNGSIARDTVQVIVNAAVNQAPTANAGLDANITLPTNTASLNGSGTDVDGTIAAYQWIKIAGPAAGIISNATAAVTSASALVQGTYRFELRVTDNSGAIDTDTIQVIVNPAANLSPTANAGLDVNITLPTNTTSLNGSGTDPDGTITAYQWTKIAGPVAGNISNATAAVTNATALVQGTYRFELRVTDNSGGIARDTVQVTVNAAANQAPTANGGLDANITLPTNTTSLNGSGTDADGTIVSYQWTKVAGPAAGNISNATAAVTSATALVQGVYRFELRVTDNSGAVDTDTMQVTVNAANQVPTANAGLNANITLPTNTTALNGSGTDADGTITAYQWTKIAGPVPGIVSNATAAITNATALVQGIYRFELRVTDNSGAVKRDTMQVTVNAALPPNQRPVADAGNSINIYLPEDSASLSGIGIDADGTITSYRWRVIAAAGTYTFSNANSAQTKIRNLKQGVYTLELAVTDNRGATSYDSMLVTVGSTRQVISSEFVNVYPNPASATLNVVIENPITDEAISMTLHDAKGASVYQRLIKLSGNTKLETIDLSGYNSGIYFLNIIFANKKQIVTKVIKL